MTERYYGEAPVDLGEVALPDWHEFMHYLYLPVRIPLSDHDQPGGLNAANPYTGLGNDLMLTPKGDKVYFPFALPERLRFMEPLIWTAFEDAYYRGFPDPYIYVTARRGFATPGNPLNRPGWHCDDFGGTDLNYIWSDAYPTRFLLSDHPLPIPEDDAESMEVMAALASTAHGRRAPAGAEHPTLHTATPPTGHLLRLSPYVIHDTPIIPPPGGMRSFFKISVSSHRYNLLGNSHNHRLRYDWPMYDRAEVRNRPQGGNSDYVIEETTDA